MNCLKCGKETTGTAVFCEECLEVMDAHPVKPGTPVQLLPRPAAERKAPAREMTAADQLAQLRKALRWMYIAVAVLSVLLCFTAVMLLRSLDTPPVSVAPNPIGRNYTAVDSSQAP